MQILLIGELWIVPNRRIEYRYEVLLDLVLRIVADNVESFKVVCKEDFEVGVVSVVVEGCVDVMVICACVGCVLDFEVFDEHEVFYDFYVLDLAVFGEESADHGLGCIVHAAHI